jgi:hypothetical protein
VGIRRSLDRVEGRTRDLAFLEVDDDHSSKLAAEGGLILLSGLAIYLHQAEPSLSGGRAGFCHAAPVARRADPR